MNDRRHELQKNELAAYLNKINTSIEPYSKLIAVAVGLLIVGGIALGLYRSKVSGDRSDATFELIQAVGSSSAERLAAVSDTYPATPAAAWSRLYEGNAHLADGLRSLYADRLDAEIRLGDAKDAFTTALAGSDDRLLRSRAHFGLARAAESLGQIDEAVDAYRKVIEANESEAMVKKAKDRIAALEKPQTKEFLAWFAKQDFSPAAPSLPPALPPGKSLPDMSDIDLPPLGQESTDQGDDKQSGDEKADEKKELKDGGLELPKDAEVSESEAGEQTPPEATDSKGDETLADPATSKTEATKTDAPPEAATESDAPAEKADKATEKSADSDDSSQ